MVHEHRFGLGTICKDCGWCLVHHRRHFDFGSLIIWLVTAAALGGAWALIYLALRAAGVGGF